jgi:hypothetical protein
MAIVAGCFQMARTVLIDRSHDVSLHSKLDLDRGDKQELCHGPIRPATIAALLRAATTNHCIAGENFGGLGWICNHYGTEIHSDARGRRFSTKPCRGAPVSEAFHKARECRSAARRLSWPRRYAEITTGPRVRGVAASCESIGHIH